MKRGGGGGKGIRFQLVYGFRWDGYYNSYYYYLGGSRFLSLQGDRGLMGTCSNRRAAWCRNWLHWILRNLVAHLHNMFLTATCEQHIC